MASTQRLPFDDNLVRRLPLPLAQLYRRAHNAKTPLERHLTAFYLWEAALKLLSSVAVVEYARLGEPAPEIAERLKNLARPSLGHWWEFVRLLVPLLAERGRQPFGAVRDLLLGRSRDDLPRAAGLDAALRQVLEGKEGARAAVRLTELVDRLVRYRNTMLGHGAPGRRRDDFNDRLGAALLAAAAEVLGRLDVLAGRRLIHVGDVRQTGGVWLVTRYELLGENALQIASLELPRDAASRLPDGDRLYLTDPEAAGGPGGSACDASAPTKPEGAAHDTSGPAKPEGAAHGAREGEELVPLHPLLVYEGESGEVLFLNARRGRRRTEYLGYTTGRTADRTDLEGEQLALLAKVLGIEVQPGEVAGWAADSQAEEPAQPEAPTRRLLGEFELLSELGRGGMGVVYRAWQPSLGRQVALKKLMAAGDEKAEARFRREIRALGRVEHPNLVKVFTSGADGDQWFYAMELIDGVSLSAVGERLHARPGGATAVDQRTWHEALGTAVAESRRAEKPLRAPGGEAVPPPAPEAPPVPKALAGGNYARQVVELVRQAATAAHALHEAGVVHRDIKPGNILVTADGTQAVLMDLGLAQLADETEGRLTRTRQFVGTLRYASPQQVLAAGPLDRRTDVYSLGATLWELLALKPLFGATEQTPTPVLMEQVQRQEPQRLRSVNPGVSRDLEAVVHRCLEKDAARRYPTAAELADDLGRYLAGEPVRARRVGRWERGWKWARRHPAPAALIGVSVLAALALLVGGAWFTWRLDQAWRLAERRAAEARENEARARAAQGRAEETLADGLLRPLGNTPEPRPLNDYELAALWDLATLPGDNERVRLLFVERALGGVATAEQLERRAPYAIHAAVGLDRRRRRQAGEVLLRHLDEPRTDWRVRRACAVAALALGSEDAETVFAAAAALAEAMTRTPSPLALARLGAALAALPPRETEKAGRTGARLLLRAMAEAKETAVLARLGEALARLKMRLTPEQAGEAVGILLNAMARTTAAGDDLDADTLTRLAEALVALAPRSGAREGEDACGKAADLVVKAMDTNPAVLAPLARTLATLEPGLGSKRYHETCGAAAGRLLKALATTSEAGSSEALVGAWAALAARLFGRQAQETAGDVLGAMETATEPAAQARLGKALAALIPRLSAKEAEDVCGKAGDLLLKATDTSDLVALVGVGEALAALAPRLGARQARRAAADLLRAMKATSNPAALAGLAGALAALGSRLEPGEAEKTAGYVVEAIATTVDVSALGPLATALGALAPRLERGQAREAAASVLKVMAATELVALAPLAEALAALAARLDAEQAREVCGTAAGILLRAMDDADLSTLGRLGKALAALAPRLNPAQAREVCGTAAALLLQALATRETDAGDKRELVSSGLAVLAGRMERDQLIELLKQPTCVGAASEIVLRRLSERLGRPFTTVWDLAAYLEENDAGVDLSAPAGKRSGNGRARR